jgi:small subunit ribosomal protein S6e
MANWKLVISEPETKKSFQLEVDQDKAAFVGKKIGDEFSGDTIGLAGYSLKITGGTDKDGFPMHPNVEGMGKRKILLSCKPCFHPKLKGQRKRKTVRGNTISDSIVQINVKVIKKGQKPLEELIPTKPKEKKEEAKPEAQSKPKEEKTVEKEAKKEGGEGSQKS